MTKSDRTMTLNLSEREMAVVEELAERHDLSKTQIIRQALRWYQKTQYRLDAGEKVIFSGDEQRMIEFVGPVFKLGRRRTPMTDPKSEIVGLAEQDEVADGVKEWLGFAKRLGPAQKRVVLGLNAQWGPSPDHQATKRMWYGVTGRGIKRQRGPVYVVEHKHRTDNCWRLNNDGLRLQVALWHLARASLKEDENGQS